jgi:hypothetical protein
MKGGPFQAIRALHLDCPNIGEVAAKRHTIHFGCGISRPRRAVRLVNNGFTMITQGLPSV